ncbi:hypothetical protein NIES4073_82780 [Kalymmatonema gypsitolerans NIES-4073]|nr:hypothetical protein NIES4073_82780 [Scytonema sp. NIES-4073]
MLSCFVMVSPNPSAMPAARLSALRTQRAFLRRTPVAVRAGKPSFARLLTVIRTTLLTTLRCSRQHCQRFVLGITSEAEADTPSVALCFFKKRTL